MLDKDKKVAWARFSANGMFHAVANKQVACVRYQYKDRSSNSRLSLSDLVASPLNPDMKCRACEDVLAGITSEKDVRAAYARAIRRGMRFEEKRKKMWLGDEVKKVLGETTPLLREMFSVGNVSLWAPGLDGCDPPGDVLTFTTAPPGYPQRDEDGDEPIVVIVADLCTPISDLESQPDHGMLSSIDGRFAACFDDGRGFRRVLCQLLALGNTARLLLETMDRYKSERRAILKDLRAKGGSRG